MDIVEEKGIEKLEDDIEIVEKVKEKEKEIKRLRALPAAATQEAKAEGRAVQYELQETRGWLEDERQEWYAMDDKVKLAVW